ncbi:MAG: hypothetical protein FWH03_08425 [Firmicutes bacterium]|nr:hypothetical protein [Bacillota bacterium]
MKILIAGAHTPIAKAFVKQHKKKHEMLGLDVKKADFSQYEPLRDIFAVHKFDAVLYLAAQGAMQNSGADADALNLFKNLQYAAILNGVPKMITVCDAGGEFGSIMASLANKDKIGTFLRVYGLIGAGLDVKLNPIAKILSDAHKRGEITLQANQAVSPVFIDDAVKVLTAFTEKKLPQGVYDIAPAQTDLLKIAQAAKKALKAEGGTDIRITLADKKAFLPPFTGNIEALRTAYKSSFTSMAAAVTKTLA